MKRAVIFILLSLFVASAAEAQLKNPKMFRGRTPSSDKPWKYRRWELMSGLGTSHLYGDIGGFTKGESAAGFKDFSFANMRFSLYGGMRYRINDWFTTRLNLTMAGFHTSDNRGSNIDRDFISSTFMFEPALLGEFDIINPKYESMNLIKRGGRGVIPKLLYTLNLYGFTGFGGAVCSINYNNENVVGTVKDGCFAPVIPVGLGLRMQYNTRISFGVEFSNRFALSDYVDGYTSQYSHHNDIYRFFNFTYCYKLRTGPKGWPILFGSGS